MGLFDGLKYGKAASELGLTVEQYKEFLQYQQSDGMTVHAYKTYLKDYAAKMSVRRYIDNVLRAAPKQVHPAKAQAYQVPAYLQKDVPLAVREPEPSFTIKDGVLVGLEVPEGCKKVVIPEGVTEIARDLLMNKADEDNIFQIEILELPSTLKKISSYGLAFLSKLENLVLPEGLEVIESFGLADSFKIKHWVFPSTVKFIGSLVFGEETYAESISILSPNAKVCSNIIYTFCNNVQLNIPRQLSYIEEYMKNMQMHSSQVDSSEYYVTTINYIDVPESGEDSHFDEIEFEIADHVLIGAYIPYGCKDVVIPDGVGRIGYMAMRGCAAERIILPATLCMFDHEVFRECKWLKEIVLPQRVVSMETGVFFGCERLESVQLPLRLESIPADTFEGCTSLTSIVLPENLKKIEWNAFHGCINLTSIVLPENLEEIEWQAFQGCASLTSIMLPENINKIGFRAFEDCNNLRSVHMLCTDAEIERGIFDGCSDVTITMPYAAHKIGEMLCDPERNIRVQYLDEAEPEPARETSRRRRRQQMPEAQPDIQPQEMMEQPAVQPVNSDSVEEPPVTERRRRRRQSMPLDTDQVTDAEMLKEENEELVAEEPTTVETLVAKPAGVLYAVGQEPVNIRVRMDRLFEKLDSAYPDKVIVALTKNHGHWAETVTELYRLLGYPDSWSFLEAYGYQVKVNEENGKGGRPVKDRTAVIDELKRRYPRPVEGSVAFLMEQNPDLAPRIKTLVNSAQSVFGMRLADYLKQEGILAEKKVEPKSEKPVVKQLTPEEKLEQIISELKRRYPTLKSAPKSLTELKEKNADLPMATLNTLTQKVVQKTAGEYCMELGLICDKERMKKDALESASDGRDGWGRQFTQTILDRGVNMFVAGEVKSLDRAANGYAAKVKGTSMYSVNIGVSGDEVRSMSCTCPYAADGLKCKHMAAVLFEANAKLYAPKVKKPQPVYGHATNAVSRSCEDNEILIISKDEAVLRAAVNCSYIDSDSVSIQPCSENPAYYLCEVRIDERRINLCGLMDMVICPMLDGRGVALGRKVDNEHEVSDIGFYDGECLWAGSEFDLMHPDSDAPDEPEEWVYECNSKKNRTWGQSKKVWKKIWNKIPYYKVRDLIATYEENCMTALTSAKESSKVSRDADRRCEPGELLIVSNYYDGIEQIVYEQEEIEPKNGIRQCTKSPDTWYAVFDLKACADVEETLNALLDMIEGDMIILARWKDETGSNRVWFFDSDNLWTNMLEEDLAKNKDPQEEFDRYHQEICGIRDEEQTEAMWRYVRSRLLGMTTVDWAHFIETYSTEEDE